MFDLNSRKIDFDKKNTVIKKNINLDKDLDCFILINSGHEDFGELLLNKVLDSIIDKVSIKNLNNDFSVALENVNSLINTWKKDNDEEVVVDVIIGILHKNNFFFSEIGKASCFLVKRNTEVIEITKKDENKKEFSFVSNGKLDDDEIIILSSKRLLKYLSKSDILDGLSSESIKGFNKNIKNILLSEVLEENMGIISFKYSGFSPMNTKKDNFYILKSHLFRLLDNKFVKKSVSIFMILREKLEKQTKIIKNVVFVSGTIVSFVLLYIILSGIIGASTNTKETELSRQNLERAIAFVGQASESVSNPDMFELNIKKAEELAHEIQDSNLFTDDVKKILDDISIIKKQFNRVETFVTGESNQLFAGDFKESIKIIETTNNKLYIIKNKSIVGPFIQGQDAKETVFDKLAPEEIFVDVTTIGNDIYLLTNESKIVNFSKVGFFSFIDVVGQKKWETSTSISSYGQNIYLVSDESKQIYKHRKDGNKFSVASSYLKDPDKDTINGIIDLAIDGGIYILKEDLSVMKLFQSPRYRLESIMINNIPNNYNIEGEAPTKIKTSKDLNYVYILLNNKIWVFQPNTKNYQDVKHLNFIGQIEGKSEKIIDFFINEDGDLSVLNEKGIYSLTYSISDDKLIVR